MARPAAIACLAVLALVAAGCGAKADQTFTAQGTVGCLKGKGFTQVTRDPAKIGFIAAFAENGGLKARASDGNEVTIAFAADEAEAKSTQTAFRAHASPFYKKRMNDIMRADRNAVMVWRTSPTQDQIDTVESCLSA